MLELLLNVGLWPLMALKPIKGQSWWKGRFAIFCSLATSAGGQTLVQRPIPLTGGQGKSFYRLREGATCRNSTVSADSHLEIGHTVV